MVLATLSAVVATVIIAASEMWLRASADGHIFTEQTVPEAPVALVLGAQVNPDGAPSPFLAARLEIARRLLAAGKVRVILVSGDHMRWAYDEPGAMRRWLVDRKIDPRHVVLDYAGFDTYDSCARANRIFGVKRAIVVTQTYHLPRAVTLCRRLGLDADGVGDDTVKQFRTPWLISSTREHGACVKAVFDVLTGRDPVYLGQHETRPPCALIGTSAPIAPVEVIMNELHTAKPPLWQDSSLAELERRAEAWLKAHHPELSDEAITAACRRFSYDWK